MESAPVENDKILASVFNKSLYLSELDGLVPEGSSQNDSSMILNALIERWVRETLILHEAEQNIPKDLNIDQLVMDYRASLIQHNYEKLLVELQLDSTITQQELTTYYEENKEQYKLDQPILRCYFMKIPLTADDLDNLQKYWTQSEEEAYVKMLEYCSNYAAIYMLEKEAWYDLENINGQLPEGRRLSSSKLSSTKTLKFKDDEHQYFLKIQEHYPAKQLAPMDYVKDQISKVILHKRKIQLLKDKKEEIYERENNRKNIKIYTY